MRHPHMVKHEDAARTSVAQLVYTGGSYEQGGCDTDMLMHEIAARGTAAQLGSTSGGCCGGGSAQKDGRVGAALEPDDDASDQREQEEQVGQGGALPGAVAGAPAGARVRTRKSFAILRAPGGIGHVMIGKCDIICHCPHHGAWLMMPIDPTGGLSGAQAGAMAKELAYKDTQTAEVADRLVALYGVFLASGCAMVRTSLIEYSNDQVQSGGADEFGDMDDVARALSESIPIGTDPVEAREADGSASDGFSIVKSPKRRQTPKKKPKRG